MKNNNITLLFLKQSNFTFSKKYMNKKFLFPLLILVIVMKITCQLEIE